MSLKPLALLMFLSVSASADEILNLLNLGATVGQQNPTTYPTYNYNLGTTLGQQQNWSGVITQPDVYFNTIPVGEVHGATAVDFHGAVPITTAPYINTLDISNWRGVDASAISIYEKPCMGYGGCSGTGLSSGYGVNYKNKSYSQPYNVNTFTGYWSLGDNNIPYINNSSRSSTYKFQIYQPTPIFSTIPSASSK